MKKLLVSAVAISALLVSTNALAAGHGPASGFGTSNEHGPNFNVDEFNHDGSAGAPNDDTTDTPTVTRTFLLQGEVAKNCSYFIGTSNTPGQQTIDLGAIGIHNGDNQANNTLFTQVDTVGSDIQSSQAGCNTDNTITLTKKNGTSGLVNPSPGDYDNTQFTANIPYSVQVGITGVAQGQGSHAPTSQLFTVSTSQSTGNMTVGAWRSLIGLHVVIPAQPSLGLLAGTYSDTMTVTLAAL